MTLDLRLSRKTICLISIYLLHIEHERKYSHDMVVDIEVLVTDAIDKGYQIILGGDFKLSLDQGEGIEDK